MSHKFEPYQIVQQLIQESRCTPGRPGLPAEVPTELRYVPNGVGDAIDLPPSIPTGQALRDFLPARASHREYATAAVELDKVATLLHYAAAQDRKSWPQACNAGNDLQFVLLANRVKDTDQFLYWYDTPGHRLVPLGPAPEPEDAASRLMLQREFAWAPLQVFVLGNLAGSYTTAGSFGHRQLLVRVGAAGSNALLAALGLGLVGCMYGGVIPSELHRLCGLDGYRLRFFYAVAIGYATTAIVAP